MSQKDYELIHGLVLDSRWHAHYLQAEYFVTKVTMSATKDVEKQSSQF